MSDRMTNAEPETKRPGARRYVLASLVGNSLEWYDFFLYATAASLVFGRLFFDRSDPLLGTIGAFAGFAVGFAARPIGGLIFGHLGDRVSRKSALVITLTLMGASTFLIGCLPTADQVGVLAPVLLTVLRIVQGIAAGGEWGGGVLLISENSQDRHRGVLSALSQSGLAIGFVLSSVAFFLVTLLPEDALLSWGWRVPFLASAAIFAVGVYIRAKIPTTDDLQAARQSGTVEKAPILQAIKESPRAILVGMGLRVAENGGSYLFLSFSLVYGTHIGIDSGVLLLGVAASMLVAAFTMPFFGWLSDKLGRKPVYLFGAVMLALIAFPFFWLIDRETSVPIIFAYFLANGVCHAAMIGTQPAYFHELFRPEVRYSGMSMAHEIASIFAGGLSPLIATALLAATGSAVPVSLYAIGLAVITIVALACSPKVHTRADDLARRASGPGTDDDRSPRENATSRAADA